MSGFRRVIVGASGSPGSLRALRYAEDLARTNGATLIPVLALVQPGGDLADPCLPPGYLRKVLRDDARQRLQNALIAAWGEVIDDPHRFVVVETNKVGSFDKLRQLLQAGKP